MKTFPLHREFNLEKLHCKCPASLPLFGLSAAPVLLENGDPAAPLRLEKCGWWVSGETRGSGSARGAPPASSGHPQCLPCCHWTGPVPYPKGTSCSSPIPSGGAPSAPLLCRGDTEHCSFPCCFSAVGPAMALGEVA
ncbi:hypothetical protein HJG60_009680 [Phyllostomus discolor]|uniref:Uncharacterized protein n=1 Tax=Phyllostomus discolor TaxID=89673 RepID=A0A834BCB2_9CHIR|nr:hypothetical protein HJG60_009680 [Phyllostomus discolor]